MLLLAGGLLLLLTYRNIIKVCKHTLERTYPDRRLFTTGGPIETNVILEDFLFFVSPNKTKTIPKSRTTQLTAMAMIAPTDKLYISTMS